MQRQTMDPSPRSYPAAVQLVDRRGDGRDRAPSATTVEAIERWLLGEALSIGRQIDLFDQFAWRLVAAGLPLDRASLHVGTLHPQLYGFAWNWNAADGFCDEVKVAEAALLSASFQRSVLAVVLRTGRTERLDTADPKAVSTYPLVAELAEAGVTDYAVVPLGGAGYHNVATVATKQPGGFTPDQFAGMERLLRLLALHVERHIALRIAGNVLDTYLGGSAGRRVLDGSIRRGTGESIEAIVWASDLRGFTDRADRLDPKSMIVLLNAYFEAMAGAVVDHGGEVLKFIGDGLLAVFPLGSDGDAAAQRAVAAALDALDRVEALNGAPPPHLAAIAGWAPLRSGIGLHEGEVFFGNVGAPERLDFTVIGAAVNAASRVEALTKQLGRPLLITAPVAARLAHPLTSLGRHDLRGLASPVELFAGP